MNFLYFKTSNAKILRKSDRKAGKRNFRRMKYYYDGLYWNGGLLTTVLHYPRGSKILKPVLDVSIWSEKLFRCSTKSGASSNDPVDITKN